MPKHTVTFRMDSEKTEALDAIALAADRDRSYVLNEAVENYIELRRWQMGHIRAAGGQAEKGQFVSAADVAAVLRKKRS
jgi:RHH-type rel operon transcriptional repressor/antitoxin RelB